MYIDDTTKQVFDKAFDLVKQGVVAAADTLKNYAPQLWAMARRQVIIEGWELIASSGVVTMVLVFLLYVTRRGYDKREWETPQGGPLDKIDVIILTGLIVSIWLVALTTLLINATDLPLNPDYWTLLRILQMRR